MILRIPVKAASDHQMDHEPEISFETDRDALAETAQCDDLAAFARRERWLYGTQQKRIAQDRALECLREDPLPKRFEIDSDVGKLGHCGL